MNGGTFMSESLSIGILYFTNKEICDPYLWIKSTVVSEEEERERERERERCNNTLDIEYFDLSCEVEMG